MHYFSEQELSLLQAAKGPCSPAFPFYFFYNYNYL